MGHRRGIINPATHSQQNSVPPKRREESENARTWNFQGRGARFLAPCETGKSPPKIGKQAKKIYHPSFFPFPTYSIISRSVFFFFFFFFHPFSPFAWGPSVKRGRGKGRRYRRRASLTRENASGSQLMTLRPQQGQRRKFDGNDAFESSLHCFFLELQSQHQKSRNGPKYIDIQYTTALIDRRCYVGDSSGTGGRRWSNCGVLTNCRHAAMESRK